MIKIYSQHQQSQQWLERFREQLPVFACVLGFTETGLIPGISAAGTTPTDRQYTAIADAEFLYQGAQPCPQHPLPPLHAGASPVLITRAIVTAQNIPVHLFNAGLLHTPPVPTVDLQGAPARCLSQGQALDPSIVHHLLAQGLFWGEKLAAQTPQGYVILGECVVGGTTTALAVLTGLGWDARGKVNSSHPLCNHSQKWQLVQQGLATQALWDGSLKAQPWQQVLAAVGDPMQIVVAGMAIAASRTGGVLLAGGTQMLAVYALIQAITRTQGLSWQPAEIMIGTTRWVTEDSTGDTVGLAKILKAPLIATQLSFAQSQYATLRSYEQGFVKEGMGAGGCAIAAHLYQNWEQQQMLAAIEAIAREQERFASPTVANQTKPTQG
ncbi:MAG: TIGR00303 family protein [Leptolyngbyaceae cyanobacterium CSU_1_4]|nr:TIGR00303 family protein [Leptolyngbyaceae cyanobacterium CSU_1_4]